MVRGGQQTHAPLAMIFMMMVCLTLASSTSGLITDTTINTNADSNGNGDDHFRSTIPVLRANDLGFTDDSNPAVFDDLHQAAKVGDHAASVFGVPSLSSQQITLQEDALLAAAGTFSGSGSDDCKCNGHSDTCDHDITGARCNNCTGNTHGDHCELCIAGYTGDAALGDCYPIIPPECVISGQYLNVITSTCELCQPGRYSSGGSTQTSCNECAINTYSNQAGSANCVICTAPMYYQPLTGATACHTCPRLYRGGNGQDYCDRDGTVFLCPAGSAIAPDDNGYCLRCDYGTFQPHQWTNKVGCDICPPGTYARPGATACTKCSIGTYQPDAGGWECISCESATQVGSTVCIECGGGEYANPITKSCQSCPIGQYQYEYQHQHTSCNLCNPGTYSAEIGSWVCEYCDSWGHQYAQWQPSYGATSCIDCTTSWHIPGALACGGTDTREQCGYGQYTNTAIEGCSLCQAGRYQPAQNAYTKWTTACLECQAGKYQSHQGSVSCEDCPSGTYQSVVGQSSCIPCAGNTDTTGRSTCSSLVYGTRTCAAGEYVNEGYNGVCTPCGAGKYQSLSNSNINECSLCDIGTYQSSTGASSCVSCPTATTLGSTICPAIPTNCPIPGSYLDTSYGCRLCPVGKYQSPANTNGYMITSCSTCAAGHYNNILGMTYCSICSHGKYRSIQGASICLTCSTATSVGWTTCNGLPEPSEEPSSSSSSSTGSDVSSSSSSTGTSGLTCGYHQYVSTAANGTVSCEWCAAGSTRPEFVHSATTCDLCVPGKYTGWARYFECQVCPGDTYAPNYGSTYCSTCTDGGTSCLSSSSSSSTGQLPEAHTSSSSSSTGTTSNPPAIVCDAGHYYDTITSQCVACPPRSYSYQASAATSCLSCANVIWSLSYGNTRCPCTGGQYMADTITSECRTCGVGTFQETTEVYATTCAQCWSGHSCATEGALIPTICEAGTYAIAGSSTCSMCALGKYQDQAGESSCRDCATATRHLGMTWCPVITPCAPGYYSISIDFPDETNMGNICEICDIGYYQPLADQPSCHKCPIGSYAPAQGMTACLPCVGAWKPGMDECPSDSTGGNDELSAVAAPRAQPPGAFAAAAAAHHTPTTTTDDQSVNGASSSSLLSSSIVMVIIIGMVMVNIMD